MDNKITSIEDYKNALEESLFDDTTLGRILISCVIIDIFLITNHTNIAITILSTFCTLIFLYFYITKKRKEDKFLNEVNMSKEDAQDCYRSLLDIEPYMPVIQSICKFNREETAEQMKALKKWYDIDFNALKYVEHNLISDYSNDEWEMSIAHIKSQDLPEQKKLVDRLFLLSTLEDGIHNDEWQMLMQIMYALNFNKHYLAYYKDRYGSLRTEFEDYEREEKTTTIEYSSSNLKEYYDILGLEEGASIEEVKRAYHELALQHHPDLPKNADRVKECEEMMVKINKAYDIVKDNCSRTS